MTERCDAVSLCLCQCIENVVGGGDYSQSQVNKWTANIVERCLTQLVKQGKPYKYIGVYLLLLELTFSCSYVCPPMNCHSKTRKSQGAQPILNLHSHVNL